MKLVIVYAIVAALLGFCAALPTPDVSHLPAATIAHPAATATATAANVVPLLERTENRDEFGQYALSYLTGDGISVAEQGALRQTTAGAAAVLVKQGAYAYVGDDGRTYTVHYVADENGYRAYGDHLPVAPKVPEVSQ